MCVNQPFRSSEFVYKDWLHDCPLPLRQPFARRLHPDCSLRPLHHGRPIDSGGKSGGVAQTLMARIYEAPLDHRTCPRIPQHATWIADFTYGWLGIGIATSIARLSACSAVVLFKK